MIIKLFSKSIKAYIIGTFLGLIIAAILFPSTALADRSLTMEQIIYDAEILPDASMYVTERITVDFKGRWEGFFVEIPIGDFPITDVVVSENGQAYEHNPGTEYGPPGTYLTLLKNNNALIDWSIEAYNQTRTFDLSYRVENAVKIHDDVAELYHKFVGEANENKVSYVQVNLKLPEGAEGYQQGEDIRIWGHGPLNGEVDFVGSNGVVWTVNNLPPKTFLEGRVVMPVALFPHAPEEAYTGQNALATILAEEGGWADKANRERMLAKAEMGTGCVLVVITLIALVFLWTRVGRKYETAFDGDYYRELPADYSPAELSVLWNFKKLKAQDMTATIMDLARRKFLFLEEDTAKVSRLIGSKEVKTYLLSFMPPPDPATLRKPNDANLRPHEADLLNYLKNDIGKGKKYIHLTDIEEHAKKEGIFFHDFWEDWTDDINKGCNKYSFFDDQGKIPRNTAIVGILLILAGLFIATMGSLYIGFPMLISGFLILIVPRFFKRRSVLGQDEFARWQAFKRFLEHFSEMQRHEIPSLIIWEHYLVYAVTLGVAKEVIKQLELVFPNMQDDDYRFGSGWLHYGTYGSLTSFNNSFAGINASLERSLQTANKAASKASSGSGGGGGFSGGGGGGGGGGSYGGR